MPHFSYLENENLTKPQKAPWQELQGFMQIKGLFGQQSQWNCVAFFSFLFNNVYLEVPKSPVQNMQTMIAPLKVCIPSEHFFITLYTLSKVYCPTQYPGQPLLRPY